jgi:serine protease AprX
MKSLKNMVLVVAMVVIASTFTNGVAQYQDGNESGEQDAPGWWHDWHRDTNHNNIDDMIEEKSDEEHIGIYINYDRHPDDEDVEKLSNFDFYVKHVYNYIDVICARDVAVKDVSALTLLPHVVMVKLEPMIVPLLDISTRSIKARASDQYSPSTAEDIGPYTGKGISIAVIDSGVDNGGRNPTQAHDSVDDLDDDPGTNDPKFIAGVDFTQDESVFYPRDGSYDPDDSDGHGTHVAGIAMGTGDGAGEGAYRGVAPQARLVDLRIMEVWGGNAGDSIAAIEWCIENKNQFNIRVLSMSYGTIFGESDGSDEESMTVNNAVEAGLVVVAAIGNDGEKRVTAPAAADGAIAVGSIDDHDTIDRSDDTLSTFSNTGPRQDDGDDDQLDELKPDVVAYGDSIMAPQANSPSAYAAKSGTSMSTPHVSGVIALMLEANPLLNPDKVKEILRLSAEPRGTASYPNLDPQYNTDYGWGIVDAYKAVLLSEEFVEVTITIDTPTMNEEVSGTVEISGTASTNKGSVSLVEISIDDPNFNTYVIRADDTDSWSITWDTMTWQNNKYHRIYARATHGEFSKVAEVDVLVLNQDGSTGDGDGGGDTGPPTVNLGGIGKISVYALAAFIGIIAAVVALIVGVVLAKRRKMTREMMVMMQSEQKPKEGY